MRASAVARLFIDQRRRSAIWLTATGYADQRPVDDNDDAGGRSATGAWRSSPCTDSSKSGRCRVRVGLSSTAGGGARSGRLTGGSRDSCRAEEGCRRAVGHPDRRWWQSPAASSVLSCLLVVLEAPRSACR